MLFKINKNLKSYIFDYNRKYVYLNKKKIYKIINIIFIID